MRFQYIYIYTTEADVCFNVLENKSERAHIEVVACVADDNKVVAASKRALASLLLVFIHLYM